MSDIGMLTGAALFLAGMVTGRAWPSRRRKPKPVQPVCGCRHHFSYHDPETGACHGTDRKIRWGVTGEHLGHHDVPCTCRTYAGPTPLPELYAPEIASTQ